MPFFLPKAQLPRNPDVTNSLSLSFFMQFNPHINTPLPPLDSISKFIQFLLLLFQKPKLSIMVVQSKQAPFTEQFSLSLKPINNTLFYNSLIPVIDLSKPDAKTLLVQACEEFGFFKVINHGIPMEFITKLESQAQNFFSLPQSEKDKAGPLNPFGYGNKKIGQNGDVGWVEYLLFRSNLDDSISDKFLNVFRQNPDFFCSIVKDYISAVKNLGCEVLELLADGLGIRERNVFSKLLNDEESDSIFRLNHYPPCPELQAKNGRNLIGFGEHTDPQIISVLRSNNTTGLQISLKDGSWVPVIPDQNSFFINVGDSLQVMSNGRFRSVRHRVMANSLESRVSMIYFGGPPMSERIVPLPSLLAEGEESIYKEFTWYEYKKSACKSRLADNRLHHFEKRLSSLLPSAVDV